MSAACVTRLELKVVPLEEVAAGFFQVSFFAMGSSCQLFFGAKSFGEAERFRHLAAQWLEGFEQRCSRFLAESEVSRINRMAGIDWVEVDATVEVLLDLCAHSHFLSQGAFDATSLPLSELWDWRKERDRLPNQEEIEAARRLVGWGRVKRMPGRVFLPERGMRLDFGGVGKEFAVDFVRQLAVANGMDQVLVDFGGDVAVHGDSPEGGGWYVALEDPEALGRAALGIRLPSGGAVATSGDYVRGFEFRGQRYGHIVDCRTGLPLSHGTRAVSVIAQRCVTAGMLSTAGMIFGGTRAVELLERTPGIEGCVWRGGTLLETRGFRRGVLAGLEAERRGIGAVG